LAEGGGEAGAGGGCLGLFFPPRWWFGYWIGFGLGWVGLHCIVFMSEDCWK
jgi:hypothetical protein